MTVNDPCCELPVQAEGLTRAYVDRDAPGGRRLALDSVSLTVAHGEFVALVGRSGSGKTTLLNVTGCLDRDFSGMLRLFGRDTSRLGDRQLSDLRNQRIGFVFQAFHLLGHLTVFQNVMLPWHFSGTSRADAESRTVDALKQVGLPDRADSFPWQLSAGERQRVAIARAILNRPSLLLCDEPTGNLDRETAASVTRIFEQIVRQSGTSVLVATHDETLAASADRIVRLVDGRLA